MNQPDCTERCDGIEGGNTLDNFSPLPRKNMLRLIFNIDRVSILCGTVISPGTSEKRQVCFHLDRRIVRGNWETEGFTKMQIQFIPSKTCIVNKFWPIFFSFVVTYRVSNFLPKLYEHAIIIFCGKKLNSGLLKNPCFIQLPHRSRRPGPSRRSDTRT